MRLLVALLALHLAITFGFTAVTSAFLALVRGDRLRLHVRGVGWFFREWAAVAVMGPLRLLGLWQPAPPTQTGGRPPVLLVPGYSLNRGAMIFLQTWLRRQGVAVWAISHGGFGEPLPVLAHRLGTRVEALKRATGAAQVDIVGHSMGGLVAGWYLRHLGGATSVRRLVTLGSPWQGTAIAVFQLHRVVADMRPDSEIIAALQGGPPVPTTVIWSREDGIVLPPERCRCEGATRHVRVPWVGHHSLLMSGEVFRRVGEALSAGSGSLQSAPQGGPQDDSALVASRTTPPSSSDGAP